MSGKSTFDFVSKATLLQFEISVPSIEIQNALVSQFNEESAQVTSATVLMNTYVARTQAAIAKLWSE
jgi:restriction endonuclease S subunit